MKTLINWLVSSLAVFLTVLIIPGAQMKSFFTALLVAVVLGVFNAVIRPILVFFTLPINILTLGLFTLVINTLIIMLAAAVVPNFIISGFFTAFIFSIILSLVSCVLEIIMKD
jgi:putative membrane protein